MSLTQREKMLMQQILDNQKAFEDRLVRMEDKVDKTLDQTKITNGRVNTLEAVQHNCPVKEIQKETDEVRFYSRHPRLLRFTVIGIFVLSLGSMITSAYAMHRAKEIFKSDPAPIETPAKK